MNKRKSGRGNKPDPEERKRKETEEPRKSEVDIQGRRKKELAAETGRMMEGHRERRDLEESHTQRTAQAGVDVPSSDGIHGGDAHAETRRHGKEEPMETSHAEGAGHSFLRTDWLCGERWEH